MARKLKKEMLSDIENRADLEKLMRYFYSQLLEDERLAYLFIDIAKMDLKTHIPRIVDFWENMLFNTVKFDGNVFEKHLKLHQASSLEKSHFDLWLDYFFKSVDLLFAGPQAEKIKTRALSIANIMRGKIIQNAQI